ncbi:MAG: glycosyltransferase family 2 protein [Nitrospirae bacterium]|nr:glycosyltransferase family 2 protein [Nitrospirota bacterium]
MISIIIPVFNLLSYTRECLSNLEKYTDIPYEIILIDNGSSDGTTEYLKGVKGHVIFNSENRGVYVAWNQGISAARSEYICIMNNDILVTPRWASALIRYSQIEPRRIVGPAMREGSLDYPLIPFAEKLTSACYQASRKLELCNFSLVLFRRIFFDEVGLFDERFFITRGDDDMVLRLQKKGIGEAVTGSAFVHHYSEKTQEDITRSKNLLEIRKRDDDHFESKWGKDHNRSVSNRIKTEMFHLLYPVYEKMRYGFQLKMTKPKKERVAETWKKQNRIR